MGTVLGPNGKGVFTRDARLRILPRHFKQIQDEFIGVPVVAGKGLQAILAMQEDDRAAASQKPSIQNAGISADPVVLEWMATRH